MESLNCKTFACHSSRSRSLKNGKMCRFEILIRTNRSLEVWWKLGENVKISVCCRIAVHRWFVSSSLSLSLSFSLSPFLALCEWMNLWHVFCVKAGESQGAKEPSEKALQDRTATNFGESKRLQAHSLLFWKCTMHRRTAGAAGARTRRWPAATDNGETVNAKKVNTVISSSGKTWRLNNNKKNF